MRTKLTVATALAGTLLATCLVSGSAQATSLPVLKCDATPGTITLVGRGGGHGGGGAMRGGGGGGHAMRGGGGGGGHAMRSGGGGYKGAYRSGSGSRHVYGGGSGGKYYGKGGGKNYGGGKGGKHYAYKDRHHDNHGNFNNRHRVFRNGAWIWVYGSAYTAFGNDCYWLRRQAAITGSPYWWDRYNACVGYDYY